MTVEQANLRVSFYCALAAYAGAKLPADIAAQLRGPHDGDTPITWWEFAPRGTDMPVFLKAARKELQRAAVVAIIRHERDQTAQTLTEARRLIALYEALAKDALGPLPLTLRADQAESASSSAAVGRDRAASSSEAIGEVRQAA